MYKKLYQTFMTYDEFDDAKENGVSICGRCKNFNSGSVDPEATGLICSLCEAPKVVGMNVAEKRGIIRVVKDTTMQRINDILRAVDELLA